MSCCESQKPSGALCPVHATALRLVELCKAGKFDQAEAELYADHIESVEPFAPPGKCKTVVGRAAHKAKNEEFHKNVTIHGCVVEGPFPQPDTGRFAVVFKMDATCAQMGRVQMNEVALYTCDRCTGKIARAEYFYAPPGDCKDGKCDDKADAKCDDKAGAKSGCCGDKPAAKSGCCG